MNETILLRQKYALVGRYNLRRLRNSATSGGVAGQGIFNEVNRLFTTNEILDQVRFYYKKDEKRECRIKSSFNSSYLCYLKNKTKQSRNYVVVLGALEILRTIKFEWLF